MANKQLFNSRAADVVRNNAGGVAFAMSDKAALVNYAMLGTFNGTYYTDVSVDIERLRELALSVEPVFLAKLAVLARERGYMRDVPAFLVAALSVRDTALLDKVFARVINNAAMLRNFVQIIRSNVLGRRSLGSAPKRLVAAWLAQANPRTLINAVGQAPSLADVIKLARPHPQDAEREALYGYFIGKVAATDARLPVLVREFEAFRASGTGEVPAVDFRLLTQLSLSTEQWKAIARDAPWQMTRMNLNTFARHGVFEDGALTQVIADRIRNKEAIARAKVFPYQLLAAYLNIGNDVPTVVAEALMDAAEVATQNVPSFEGKVFVFPDVSGSMQAPVTGFRKGSSSKVRCVDVAGLVAATVLRRNPDAEVIAFEGKVVDVRLSPRDSILTNAQKLAAVGGGSTNCSAPLALLNQRKVKADLLFYVSDYESWIDVGSNRGTATAKEWQRFKARQPQAKLACLDLVPNRTTQVRSGEDVLNIGGFSDAVFDILSEFVAGRTNGDAWVKAVDAVVL